MHDPCIIKAGDHVLRVLHDAAGRHPGADPLVSIELTCCTGSEGGTCFTSCRHWASRQCRAPSHAGRPTSPSSTASVLPLLRRARPSAPIDSVIGLATNSTLDPADAAFHWQDMGLVLESESRATTSMRSIPTASSIAKASTGWHSAAFWTGLEDCSARSGDRQAVARCASARTIAQRPRAPDAIEAVFIIQRAGNYYLVRVVRFLLPRRRQQLLHRGRPLQGYSRAPMSTRAASRCWKAVARWCWLRPPGEPRWRGPGAYGDPARCRQGLHRLSCLRCAPRGRPTLRIAPLGWTEDNWPVAFV
jgi:hypothetical protein